ncbi:MAG: SET domain-containing protein [Desulfobaccales bacterium]|jgi:SET domain-containing protein
MKFKFPKIVIKLKPSRIDNGGVGVFAVTAIKKGEKVADGIPIEDLSEVIPWNEVGHLDKNVQKKVKKFCVGTIIGFVPPDNNDFNKLSIEWYFNHSCNGNLGFDKNGDFIAIRYIKNGEELSYDYGLIESNPNFKMKCKCHNYNCREIVTGNDWKVLAKDKSKIKYMHPFLISLIDQTIKG